METVQQYTCSAASQWFCNGSVYTQPSVIHTDGSVIVLYGSVDQVMLKIWNELFNHDKEKKLPGSPAMMKHVFHHNQVWMGIVMAVESTIFVVARQGRPHVCLNIWNPLIFISTRSYVD